MAALALDITCALRHFAVDVDLTVGPGETLALTGPSGAGKTTILRAVAGVVRPDAGTIALGGERWFGDGVDRPPERRSVGYVPQDGALFAHLDVTRNVAFAGAGPQEVAGLLDRLHLAHLAHARPAQLSGGERRRVALARALARDPAVLLLDEPLTGLDALTAATVRAALGEVLAQLALPTLLVTHDLVDAEALGATVAVVQHGVVTQSGTAAQLRAAPGDAFAEALVARAGVTDEGPRAKN